jgi:thiol:disulfide interchange protein DsbD
MKPKITIGITFILILISLAAGAEPEILSVTPRLIAQSGRQFSVAIDVQIQNDWHINSNKPNDQFLIPTALRIASSDAYKIKRITFPEHILKRLAFSDTPLAVFEGNFFVQFEGTITAETDSVVNVAGTFYYQGCNDQVCLPPTEIPFSLKIPVQALAQSGALTTESIQSGEPETPQGVESASQKSFDVGSSLAEKGYLLTFILIFLGGLGLNLTPCVYPLIPVTLSYFGGQAVGKKSKTFLMALLYVLGLALVNSLLGTLAAVSGGLLGAFMTNPIVLIVIAAIMLAMALSMFGLYEFGLPNFLMNMAGGSQSGYPGALLMGLTMGIVAAPCIGPFVIGLLTYVAAVGQPLFGFLMFFTLSLGLGLPFLILAFFAAKIDRLPRSGEWMVGVRQIFGFLLVGMALYFIKPLLPSVIASKILWLDAIASGIYLILFSKAGNKTRVFVFIKNVLAIAAILTGTWFLKPEKAGQAEMQWQIYSSQAYESALQAQRPVILDFYADWCIPCKELEQYTFSDPEVIRLSENYALFKVDLTGTPSPEIKALQEQFNVKGVPTVIFIARDGKEFKDLRLLGFEKADVVSSRLRTALK